MLGLGFGLGLGPQVLVNITDRRPDIYRCNTVPNADLTSV